MERQLITFDQLAALSFLRFGKLDGVDMTLLIQEFDDIVSVELDDESDDYLIMKNGIILLNDSYVQKINKNVNKELFEKILGCNIQRYLDNIDMYKFILKKIKMLNPCCSDEEDVLRNFSLLQIRFLKKLYQERYVMNFLQRDSINGDYYVIKLTKRGELYLFLKDYSNEIEKFKVFLDNNGYNSVLLEAFLITQDLSLNVTEILRLENFITFFGEYDVNPYASDLYRSEYKRVRGLI